MVKDILDVRSGKPWPYKWNTGGFCSHLPESPPAILLAKPPPSTYVGDPLLSLFATSHLVCSAARFYLSHLPSLTHASFELTSSSPLSLSLSLHHSLPLTYCVVTRQYTKQHPGELPSHCWVAFAFVCRFTLFRDTSLSIFTKSAHFPFAHSLAPTTLLVKNKSDRLRHFHIPVVDRQKSIWGVKRP